MSALKSLLVAALASTAFIGAAHAREAFTAKLEAPAAESRVITLNTIWTCDGDTCVARPNHASTVRACRQFVRETGIRVVAYGPAGQELSAEEIARCNGETPSLLQAQN